MFSTISYITFLFLFFINIVQSAIPTPRQQQTQINHTTTTTTTMNSPSIISPTTAAVITQQKPVYNIGIIFPNTTVVRADDPTLGDMIITCELAIQLAADSIKQSGILPGMLIVIYTTRTGDYLTNIFTYYCRCGFKLHEILF
jgi:hypothetical protein